MSEKSPEFRNSDPAAGRIPEKIVYVGREDKIEKWGLGLLVGAVFYGVLLIVSLMYHPGLYKRGWMALFVGGPVLALWLFVFGSDWFPADINSRSQKMGIKVSASRFSWKRVAFWIIVNSLYFGGLTAIYSVLCKMVLR